MHLNLDLLIFFIALKKESTNFITYYPLPDAYEEKYLQLYGENLKRLNLTFYNYLNIEKQPLSYQLKEINLSRIVTYEYKGCQGKTPGY